MALCARNLCLRYTLTSELASSPGFDGDVIGLALVGADAAHLMVAEAGLAHGFEGFDQAHRGFEGTAFFGESLGGVRGVLGFGGDSGAVAVAGSAD